MNDLWGSLIMGILLAVGGIYAHPDGYVSRGVYIPGEVQLPLAAMGIILAGMSLWGLLRGEGKEKPPTDEDIRKARETLERIHLHEYGVLPGEPDEKQGQEPGDAPDRLSKGKKPEDKS